MDSHISQAAGLRKDGQSYQSGRRPEKSRREAPAGGPGGGSPLATREAASSIPTVGVKGVLP